MAEIGENIGKEFLDNKKIRNYLKNRNDSILAHGIIPVTEDIFNNLYKEVLKITLPVFKSLESMIKESEFPELILI